MAELCHQQWGEGRPLVLLPGWGQPAASFAPLAAELPGWRLLAPELPGQGGSAPAVGLAGWTTALVDWFQRQQLADAVLGGWSLGGLLALCAWPQLRSAVRALLLLGVTPRFVTTADWPGQPEGQVRALARLLERDPQAALNRFQSLMLAGAVTTVSPGRVEAESAELLAGLEILRTTDLRPQLPAVAAPALVLHGDRDGVVPPAAGRLLAAALPAGRFELLFGIAHALPLEAPAVIARLLREWQGG